MYVSCIKSKLIHLIDIELSKIRDKRVETDLILISIE